MPENEIKTLITSRLQSLGMSKVELVARLGYQHRSRGLNRLEKLMEGLVLNPFILKKLHIALDMEEEEVQAALQVDFKRREKEAEEKRRRAFRPHLFVLTERDMPSSIAMCALTGASDKFVYLPDGFCKAGLEEECRQLKQIIVDHVRKKNGKTIFFGQILVHPGIV